MEAGGYEHADDGRVGQVRFDADGPATGVAGVRPDGTVPGVEYRAGLDWERVERTAGPSLWRLEDPVEAGSRGGRLGRSGRGVSRRIPHGF